MSSSRTNQCQVCFQQFSRNEHLQRHQLTHHEHNNRPFRCKICLETFSRSDVLKRHEMTQHSYGNKGIAGFAAAGSRKSRATIACDPCAKAKIRCNGLSPCDRCKTRNLTCTLARPHSVLRRRLPGPQSNVPGPVSMETGSDNDRIIGHTGEDGLAARKYSVTLGSQIQPALRRPPQRDYDVDEATENKLHDAQFAVSTSPLVSSTTTLVHHSSHSVDDVQAAGANDLDTHSTVLSFAQPTIYSAMDAANPSAVFDFPTDLWFQGLSPSFSNILATESSPIRERPKPTPSIIYGTSPYASCPLSHVLEAEEKDPTTLAVAPISNFIQNRKCWEQIREMTARQSSNDVRSLPTIDEQTRDALVAITHITLSRSLESACVKNMPLSFPPLETVQSLFRSCFARFTRLYPIIHPKTFDTGANVDRGGVTYPIFLQNVMVLGAMLLSVKESRAFASELAFLVRKAMNDVMAQDVSTTDDIWMLTSTILITASGVWSGDKIHVELAEAYRGSYTTMFNRRGYLKPQQSFQGHDDDDENEWQNWISRERKRRLCYVWYIVEQEISFFHCIAPHITFADMRAPLPGPDVEFFAETESEWRVVRESRVRATKENSQIRPPSLAALYWLFTRDDFMHLAVDINPLHLRLLQCAIQTQVLQHSQASRFVNVEQAFPQMPSSASTYSRTTATAQLRLEELQNHLVKWYILSKRLLSSTNCSELAVACYLMHHLISMELYVCFDDVQCLAGKDGHEVGQSLLTSFQRWANSSSSLKAISHAGQVIKILQASYPCENYDYVRPLWWPVALVRATLVLWSYAVSNIVTQREQMVHDDLNTSAPRLVPINDPNENTGPYGKVVQPGEGDPGLVDADGICVSLNHISETLGMILMILEDGKSKSSPLCESIHQFIQDLQRHGVPY